MHTFDNVQDLLASTLAGFGLAGLVLGPGESLTLDFDEVPLTFTRQQDELELLWVHVDICKVDPSDTDVLQYLLSLGFETWAQNLFSLAYCRERQRAYAFNGFTTGALTEQSLLTVLGQYVELARAVRQAVTSGHAAELGHGVAAPSVQPALSKRDEFEMLRI